MEITIRSADSLTGTTTVGRETIVRSLRKNRRNHQFFVAAIEVQYQNGYDKAACIEVLPDAERQTPKRKCMPLMQVSFLLPSS